MSPNPTFATLRALHALMGDALDDIHRIFSDSSTPHSSQCSSPAFPDSPEPVSVPATPLSSTFSTQTSSYGTPLSPLSNLQYDYPSPSLPYISSSPAEKLAACPAATAAATRIISAAGQITSIVQKPFLFMSDASMVYTVPACLRLIEHLHIVEILRDAEDERQRLLLELRIIAELQSQSEPVMVDQAALTNGSNGPNHNSVKGLASRSSLTRDAPTKAEEKALHLEGVHVKDISRIITERMGGLRCVDSVRLAHPLRLLSTHHILRETAPDTFALTRVASLLDSGKSVADVFANPEKKYEDTSGIAAFVGLCTDELFKSAAYLTEAFTGVQLPLAPPGSAPTRSADGNEATEYGREAGKSFRLERFSQAMIGTSGWEAPGAILTAFDWLSLPRGSTIVDVGGGIGSTTMILARAFGGSPRRRGSVSSDEAEVTVENNSFVPQRSCNDLTPHKSRSNLKSFASRGDLRSPTSRADLKSTNLKSAHSHADLRIQSSQGELSAQQPTIPSCEDQDMQFRFIVQDRPVVIGLGLDAWRAQCPEMLESGQVMFYDHDFFRPQPPLPSSDFNQHPAVYILRVVLHDWPDARARHVLLNLRLASSPETRLIIADHILPLACVDEGVRSAKHEHQKSDGGKWTLDSVLAHLEGAHGTLAPAPLLPNLGKASATPFSMDIVMHITFNGKERTLRELCALALSSGWRIARVTYSKGSHFGHLVCEPVDIPEDAFNILPGRPISDPAIDLSFECAEPSEDDEHEGPQTAQEIYANKLPSSLGSRPISTTILPLLPSPILERSSSRCGTPTFGSRVFLPRPDEIPSGKSKSYSLGRRWLKARGLGVRSVVEKQKRREEGARKADEHDDQSGPYGSPQHSRVWWKRAPPTSPVAEERASDASIPRSPLRLRRGTMTTPELSPPLPLQSPRIPTQYNFPAHRTTPSVQSNFQSDGSSSAPRSRRPSVASLTRKLNFSPFARRQSIVDGGAQRNSDTSASPQSTTLDTAYVRSANQEKKLKHQPSSPMMQKHYPGDDREHSIRHHPSAPHLKGRSTRAEEPPPLPTAPKIVRDDASCSAPRKSNLMSSPIFSGSKSSLSTTTSRQRSRSILSSTPALIRAPSTPADPASPKSKRQPSTPKLPRRLSIPMLRRKRSQSLTAERDT
ncbi:hypothetical protein C8R48DRAFT_634050 [Suillus tomentosus]|nr:hypothetical protein C8R48DRAFT_634050 [Suillus tomentosus]